MNSTTPNRRMAFGSLVAVVLAFTLAFATGAVGSGTSDSIEIQKLKQQVVALQKAQRVVQSQTDFLNVSTRIAFIGGAGMHAMEGRYNTTGLTTRDIEAIQNVLFVSAKIGWPAGLKGEARTLVTSCREFLAAWNAGNKADAFVKLQAAHEAYHVLVASGYKWLS